MKCVYRSVCFFLIALKESLEEHLDSWQKEVDNLIPVFRELGKCKRKDLMKEDSKLATKVATVEKAMLKRVNFDAFFPRKRHFLLQFLCLPCTHCHAKLKTSDHVFDQQQFMLPNSFIPIWYFILH